MEEQREEVANMIRLLQENHPFLEDSGWIFDLADFERMLTPPIDSPSYNIIQGIIRAIKQQLTRACEDQNAYVQMNISVDDVYPNRFEISWDSPDISRQANTESINITLSDLQAILMRGVKLSIYPGTAGGGWDWEDFDEPMDEE